MIKNNRYSLYLLTFIDVILVKDDLRDRPNERETVFNAFEKALNMHEKNYILLKGDKTIRFKKAITEIDRLLLKDNKI